MIAACPKCGGQMHGTAAFCPECLKRVSLHVTAVEEGDSTEVNDLLPETARQQRPHARGTAGNLEGSERWGDYELLEPIGRGAMGTVYKARHTRLNRWVALKAITLGMDTRTVIARFEAERQALAMMDHPNIATVLDAGATERGRPYFVMEFVQGVRITKFCDENKLSLEARLKLFIQVCHAIQHAHQKGIIHRDIKPSNILVMVNDGVAVPKVIDFGIAKATQGRLTDQTLFTAFDQFVGTPAYMSPEQASLANVEADTRSDIYSLGVLLYELLTDQTPFGHPELMAMGVDEMRRTIREKDPVRPSTRLSAMRQEELLIVATHRQTTTEKLLDLVRGDLDWIVMKCLQKDRARRYETVNGLAMDLLRHLNHQTVLARPDTQAYRVARFVRRHRASATFAALIFVALTAGMVGTITQAHRATQHAALEAAQRRRADDQARAANEQRDFALRQLSRAEAINDLNAFLLSDAAPVGKSFTVGDLLARAERILARQSGESDDNRVELLIAIGRQYQNQEEHKKAHELLTQAYNISRRLSDASIRAKATAAFGDALALAGESERGEALIQQSFAELPDAPQYTLARVFCLIRGAHVAAEGGQVNLAVERCQEASRLVRQSGPGLPLLELSVAMDLAEFYRRAGRTREAVGAFAEASKQLSAMGRDETDKAATLFNNWGVAVELLGKPIEAESLYRRAIALGVAEGDEENVSPMLLNNLARSLTELFRFAEAAEIADRAYARAQRTGAENVMNLCLNTRAVAYRELGQLDRSGELVSELEGRWKRMLPAGHIAFSALASQQSLLALARGDAGGALEFADRAVRNAEAAEEGRDRLPFFLLRRARIRMRLGQAEEARVDAARALTLTQEASGPEQLTCWNGRSHLALGRAYSQLGKVEEARAAYTVAVEHLKTSLGAEHPETVEAIRGVANQ